MTNEIREMRALDVTNGVAVWVRDAWHMVRAAHYAGPIDGSGTTTLELSVGEWQGPASTILEVV